MPSCSFPSCQPDHVGEPRSAWPSPCRQPRVRHRRTNSSRSATAIRRDRPMRTVGNSPAATSSYSFDRDTPSSRAAAGSVTSHTWRCGRSSAVSSSIAVSFAGSTFSSSRDFFGLGSSTAVHSETPAYRDCRLGPSGCDIDFSSFAAQERPSPRCASRYGAHQPSERHTAAAACARAASSGKPASRAVPSSWTSASSAPLACTVVIESSHRVLTSNWSTTKASPGPARTERRR